MKVEQDGIFPRDSPSPQLSGARGQGMGPDDGPHALRVGSKEHDDGQQMLLKSFDGQQKTDYAGREHTATEPSQASAPPKARTAHLTAGATGPGTALDERGVRGAAPGQARPLGRPVQHAIKVVNKSSEPAGGASHGRTEAFKTPGQTHTGSRGPTDPWAVRPTQSRRSPESPSPLTSQKLSITENPMMNAKVMEGHRPAGLHAQPLLEQVIKVPAVQGKGARGAGQLPLGQDARAKAAQVPRLGGQGRPAGARGSQDGAGRPGRRAEVPTGEPLQEEPLSSRAYTDLLLRHKLEQYQF